MEISRRDFLRLSVTAGSATALSGLIGSGAARIAFDIDDLAVGATLDIEWNHLQQKLLRGLGIVAMENQARI
jgi:hypothetical protein